jgi:hypothetical protein
LRTVFGQDSLAGIVEAIVRRRRVNFTLGGQIFEEIRTRSDRIGRVGIAESAGMLLKLIYVHDIKYRIVCLL